ncbi:MAG: DUF948 domain-containing protein [Alkalibacterium sp.]|uniref:Uncharacterized protein YoxC, contains an MCP-like domain n=1 Tax=Alkalibacterium gilvum TaxID=1130080 RepID=A0A1H6RKR7_9LACT|nr:MULTISPECIES: DUF948 domain-containing protein [Alkalibacterium]MDN6293467.1 DUF948 domain-containing protein [Alkalibacterium sp.]MDN6295190.1 DUF948 domain-containing protein [Alkalibacterium sp.]MDN6327079.1 DUF948 domain-containing protein [Alkalibacterium sp.]MDN6398445.1 DUF948 domain-containing protein [Alkalibacterium sp.]MDN6728921.1 DUF948 domain-containing protein [Alkalibacterium sp.]
MTGGEIAALIAAIAFAVLVLGLVYVLFKVAKMVSELNTTVEEANKSLSTITKDADLLLIEVEGLLNKSNVTLDDVNGKLGLTDPLFKAVGDLGESVSSLNNSTRNLSSHLASASKRGASMGIAKKVGSTMSKDKSK